MRADRINKMEQFIIAQSFISLQELSDKFDISINTVRRDVEELCMRGNVKKVYGGVSSVASAPSLTTVSERQRRNYDLKMRIGEKAATFVGDDSLIFLDSGSTAVCMVPFLKDRHNVTIITHSLTVMNEVAKYPNLNLIGIGGSYCYSPSSFIGLSVIESISSMSFDMVFVGTTSILPIGLSTNIYLESELKKTLVRHGRKVFLLADASKNNQPAVFNICSFEDIDIFVTDREPDKNIVDVLKSQNVQIVLA